MDEILQRIVNLTHDEIQEAFKSILGVKCVSCDEKIKYFEQNDSYYVAKNNFACEKCYEIYTIVKKMQKEKDDIRMKYFEDIGAFDDI